MMNDQGRFSSMRALDAARHEERVRGRIPGREAPAAPRTPSWATLGAILVLCLVGIVFCWKTILLHQALVPIDILYAVDPLWRPLAPPSFRTPANPVDYDNIAQFYPWAQLAAQALHRRVIPLWDPYAFTGTPFLAAMQPAVLYPVNALVQWLVPGPDITGVRSFVHLVIALIGVFLFARALGLSRLGSLMAAIAFGLSLPFIVWLEHPIDAAVAWLPLMLLCAERVFTTRGSMWWLLATAIIMALEMLAGHGESTAHALLLWGAYVAFRGALAWSQRGEIGSALQPVLVLAIGLAFGIGVAAPQLLPVLAQLPASEAAVQRDLLAKSGVTLLLGTPLQWVTLVVAMVPDFFGNPIWHQFLWPISNYHELALYIGAVPLLLALFAVVRHRTPHVIFFTIAALVALGLALGLPILSLANGLPVLRLADNGRLRIEYALAAAMLAGYGLDALPHNGTSRVAWRLAWVWSLAATVLSVAAVLMLHSVSSIVALAQRLPLLERVAVVFWPSLHSSIAQAQGHSVARPLSLWSALPAAEPVLWLALFLVLLWLYRRGALKVLVLQQVVLCIVVLDLLIHGSAYHTSVPRVEALTVPPAVRAVQADHSLYRVVGLGSALLPTTSSLFGLQDVRGYDPAYGLDYGRYFATMFTVGSTVGSQPAAPPFADKPILDAREPSSEAARGLDLMNVKYIFAGCGIHLNTHLYPGIYRDGISCVYLNRGVMPRAQLIYNMQWAWPKQAAELLGRGTVDPRSTVLLDPSTADRANWAIASARPRNAAVHVTGYDLNTVDVSVRGAARGLLVLTDAYAPGWHAYVDGRAAPIARADGVFRAVAIEPGTHLVRFVYQPAAFIVGVVVSGIALVGLLLLFLGALWQRHTSAMRL